MLHIQSAEFTADVFHNFIKKGRGAPCFILGSLFEELYSYTITTASNHCFNRKSHPKAVFRKN